MESRAFTIFDITWVVRILFENSDLVEQRERFCLGLGVSRSDMVDFLNAKRFDSRGFFDLVLKKWISNSRGVTFEKLIKVLKTENFESTAEDIKKCLAQTPLSSDCIPEQNSSANSEWFDVPEEITMFTGRVEDLQELHVSVRAQNSETKKYDITSLCGMGGVGKTSLAVQYAWAYVNVFYTNVIWINGETRTTIGYSFNRLARTLGQDMSLEFRDVVSGIYKRFGKTNTLIIFDNIECYEDVKFYTPTRSPNALRPYILLTTRNRHRNSETDLIDVNVFSPKESVQLFKSYLTLRTVEELEQAKEISVALQNLPLAIRQAGAYIRMQYEEGRKREPKMEVMKSYLQLFISNSIEVLGFDYSSHTGDIYEKTIFSTWTVNIEKLARQNGLTRTIVEFISYLNSDNIPIKLFYNIPKWLQGGLINSLLRKSCVGTTDVDSAVRLLEGISLIKCVNKELISVHSLLQEVVRNQVQQKYKGSQFDWIIDLIEIPLRLNNNDDYEDFCLLHALSIRKHIVNLRLDTARIKSFSQLIECKQNNSVSNNLKLLQNLLQQEEFDNALKAYKETGKLPFI